MKNKWPWHPLHIPNELEEMEVSEFPVERTNIFKKIIQYFYNLIKL